MTPVPNYPGARWWKFDFHTHTPASTDFGRGSDQQALMQMTPEDWLMRFMTARIDCVAITDHNSGAWVDKLQAAYSGMIAEKPAGFRELTLFPGVEISVSGGFHLLAIFSPEKTTSDIDTLLGQVDYDGKKGESDGVTRKSPVEVAEAIHAAGGIAIPAHVDDAKGLFEPRSEETTTCKMDANTIRQLFHCEKIEAIEVISDEFSPPQIYSELKLNWSRVLGTDWHGHPDKNAPAARFTWIKIGSPELTAIRLALHDGGAFSIARSTDKPAGYSPNDAPENWIESVEVTNALMMGARKPALFNFSPWLNALIGGRGSGKSTVVHLTRLVTRRDGDFGVTATSNRVQKTFRDFTDPERGQTGGLTEATEVSLIYRKGAEKFRLN